MIQQEEHGLHLIAQRNPRPPLFAAAQRPADEQAEGQQQPFQRPARAGQHQPGAQQNPPHAQGLCRLGGLFPIHAHRGEIILPRGGFFGQHVLAFHAVVAHRRGLQQQSRAFLGLFQRAHQRLAAVHAALADARFALGVPAARADVFARQVHQGIRLFQPMHPALRRASVPGGGLRACRQPHPLRIAAEHRHRVAALHQPPHKGLPNQAAPAQDQYAHVHTLRFSDSFSRCKAVDLP